MPPEISKEDIEYVVNQVNYLILCVAVPVVAIVSSAIVNELFHLSPVTLITYIGVANICGLLVENGD